MFYIKHFVHRMTFNAQHLNSNIHFLVQRELIKKMEGSCTSCGYIISVLRINKISQGKILLNGSISFVTNYEALVIKPEKGEIIDAKIISTSKLGFFAGVGPLSIFISNYQIPQNILQNLGQDVIIRLKIIGMKIDTNKMYAIGTLNEDCLGVLH